MPIKPQKAARSNCRATTNRGRACAAPAMRGTAYCALHADPNRAAELGRKGGARNRKVYDGDAPNVPAPQSLGEVKRMLAQTMADLRAGRMDPKVASTLAYVAAALLRAYEVDTPSMPAQDCIPSFYRTLSNKGTDDVPIEVLDYNSGKPIRDACSTPEVPPITVAETELTHPEKRYDVEILDC